MSENREVAEGSLVPQKEHQETEKHYQMRLHVYTEAIKNGESHDKAIVLMNVFKSAYFMGCQYHPDVMTDSQRYWPKHAIENPIYLPEDS